MEYIHSFVHITLSSVAILAIIAALLFWLFYKNGAYYRITGKPFYQVIFDLGNYGEYLIWQELHHLEKRGAKFLFNCYIPKADGETTEIDVLLIHESGLYVFESKNYSGWIFGSAKSRNWTQTLPRGRGNKAKKTTFLNPMFQNALHIKCLKEILGEDHPMHSVIVFSNRCTLKKVESDVPDHYIINRRDVGNVIRKVSGTVGNVLSDEQRQKIYDILYPTTQVSEETKTAHIVGINMSKKQRIDPVPPKTSEAEKNALVKCPKCGRELVKRKAKKGDHKGEEFWGCSGFPKCRYTAKK